VHAMRRFDGGGFVASKCGRCLQGSRRHSRRIQRSQPPRADEVVAVPS
jgi:hypothetical protein